ncbi:Zn-ribbon domain-containing OB-fold protein [Halosimplex amylolyticum]|uniref:Zn-ribbon domain-containing OB-fold protein n=1 Tax=Halosimplex amylolyticum TaxID=3396616 RepID=UPI003F56EA8F
MSDKARDGQYDDLLDAIEDGEGYYVACANGHGWLPPRRVCPDCGSRELTETPLPDSGEVATFTTVSVATPQFSADTPYVTAIVDYGPVRVTGLLRGVDPDDIEVGMPVGVEVGERETTGDRAIVFRPR